MQGLSPTILLFLSSSVKPSHDKGTLPGWLLSKGTLGYQHFITLLFILILSRLRSREFPLKRKGEEVLHRGQPTLTVGCQFYFRV